jgi:hypothetical protein
MSSRVAACSRSAAAWRSHTCPQTRTHTQHTPAKNAQKSTWTHTRAHMHTAPHVAQHAALHITTREHTCTQRFVQKTRAHNKQHNRNGPPPPTTTAATGRSTLRCAQKLLEHRKREDAQSQGRSITSAASSSDMGGRRPRFTRSYLAAMRWRSTRTITGSSQTARWVSYHAGCPRTHASRKEAPCHGRRRTHMSPHGQNGKHTAPMSPWRRLQRTACQGKWQLAAPHLNGRQALQAPLLVVQRGVDGVLQGRSLGLQAAEGRGRLLHPRLQHRQLLALQLQQARQETGNKGKSEAGVGMR